MKKILGLVIVIILVILIIRTSSSGTSDVAPTSKGPIKIGQMSGLTGVGSDIGEEERNGSLLALEQINKNGGIHGRSLEMISEDTPPFDLKKGALIAEKLSSIDNVVAIVGPQWDSQGEVLASFSASRKIPVVSQNVSTDIESKIDSPYFFTTWPDNEVGVNAVLSYAQKRGWKKIAIVEPANFSFWLYTANLLEKNASSYGIDIVAREMGTDFANVDYRTLLSKVKSKKPDAIFGSYADLECVFLKQSAELGLDIPLLSTESAGSPKALSECPEIMRDRLYFSTPYQGNSFEQFVSEYQNRFGRKPTSPSAVTAYNAMLVLGHVMNELVRSGKQINRENIRTGLATITFEGGVSAKTITFNNRGFIVTQPDAFEIQTERAGQFVKVE